MRRCTEPGAVSHTSERHSSGRSHPAHRPAVLAALSSLSRPSLGHNILPPSPRSADSPHASRDGGSAGDSSWHSPIALLRMPSDRQMQRPAAAQIAEWAHGAPHMVRPHPLLFVVNLTVQYGTGSTFSAHAFGETVLSAAVLKLTTVQFGLNACLQFALHCLKADVYTPSHLYAGSTRSPPVCPYLYNCPTNQLCCNRVWPLPQPFLYSTDSVSAFVAANGRGPGCGFAHLHVWVMRVL